MLEFAIGAIVGAVAHYMTWLALDRLKASRKEVKP